MQNPSPPFCGQPYRRGSQKPCASCKNPVRENSLFLRRPPVFRIAAGGKTGYICADNAALYDFAQIILRGYDLRRTLLCQAFLCRALLCRAVLYRLLFCGTALCPVILCRAVLRRTISCGTVLCGALLLLTSAKGMWESLCCRGGEPASLCRVRGRRFDYKKRGKYSKPDKVGNAAL